MLKPDKDRLNYSDMLKPPVDYEVEFAVGTTYSLDLEALIGVPLAFSLSEEMNHAVQDDPIYMLEGIRRATDKFLVFCEAGQIKVPQNQNNVFALMEGSIHEIVMDNDYSFHPKIWFVKYINNEGKPLYRLLVLTRNLTFDRSWDIALSLEGELKDTRNPKSQPLIDFLTFLQAYDIDPNKDMKMRSLISELPFVHFEPASNYVDYEFIPLGIKGYGKKDTGLFETFHQLIVMSPFLSESTVNELKEKSLSKEKPVLITRRTELHKLSKDIVNLIDIYVLREMVIEGEGAISEEVEEDREMAQLQDIHAKLYARSKDNQHHFFIGSANCSKNAFHGNVEFLLKLKYKKYGFRMEHLLKDIFGEEDEENPFEKIEILPDFEEDKEVDLKEALQRGIKQLYRQYSKAMVTEKQGSYDLVIEYSDLPEDINFSIRPLLSAVSEKILTKQTVFSKLSMLELSEFYRVKAEKDGEYVERIIKIDTEGIPVERDSEIYKSIISNTTTFLKYVAFLLADDFLLAALEQFEKNKLGNSAWDMTGLDFPVLYEHMLKAVSRSPDKFTDVDYIIDVINDEEIIPNDFDELYQTFKRANQKRWNR
ncbi:hypothetical protein SAMN05216389_10169 [Oceanobacillus limi]|uniref:PLD phosphodiesterase domain-containing protein n=1 Tax=Oceanobacillus limi TaxID=930131 RepID=A0A1H9Y157_9BACI|nr:phospholipase D family protein [Oceanobacillus limi]SES61964.1 hypothetical protein SAMN05216389_10169 [Oceanobacillus limi]